MTRLDSAAAARRRSTRLCRGVPSPWRNADLFGSALCDVVSPNGARPELVDREGSFRAVGGRPDAARLKCLRAWQRVRESEPFSLRIGIRNRSYHRKMGL